MIYKWLIIHSGIEKYSILQNKIMEYMLLEEERKKRLGVALFLLIKTGVRPGSSNNNMGYNHLDPRGILGLHASNFTIVGNSITLRFLRLKSGNNAALIQVNCSNVVCGVIQNLTTTNTYIQYTVIQYVNSITHGWHFCGRV